MYHRPQQPPDWLTAVPPFVSLAPHPQCLSPPSATDRETENRYT